MIVFNILFGFLFGAVICGLLWILFIFLPNAFRSYRIKKISEKFNLNFESNLNKMFGKFGPSIKNYKRNILTGNINGHSIEIYDYYEKDRVGFYGHSYRNINRSIVFKKNDKEVKYRGLFGIIPPVSKIRKILTEIKKS